MDGTIRHLFSRAPKGVYSRPEGSAFFAFEQKKRFPAGVSTRPSGRG